MPRLLGLIDVVRSERTVAGELIDKIKASERLDNGDFAIEYRRLNREAKQIEDGFSVMITVLEDMYDRFDALGRELHSFLEDSIDEAKGSVRN